MATDHDTRPYALYRATLCGFRDITEHLVDTHLQDVNTQCGLRMCVTPLHATAEKGHWSVAMFLVESGANMESRDSPSLPESDTAARIIVSWACRGRVLASRPRC